MPAMTKAELVEAIKARLPSAPNDTLTTIHRMLDAARGRGRAPRAPPPSASAPAPSAPPPSASAPPPSAERRVTFG
jgi:hypothetical protein